jgi:hypothetical protein
VRGSISPSVLCVVLAWQKCHERATHALYNYSNNNQHMSFNKVVCKHPVVSEQCYNISPPRTHKDTACSVLQHPKPLQLCWCAIILHLPCSDCILELFTQVYLLSLSTWGPSILYPQTKQLMELQLKPIRRDELHDKPK